LWRVYSLKEARKAQGATPARKAQEQIKRPARKAQGANKTKHRR
jgi:hypothetical protein